MVNKKAGSVCYFCYSVAMSLNTKEGKYINKNFTYKSGNGRNYPPCPNCKKTNHSKGKCWWRPDIKCNKCCQLGHIERVCKAQQEKEVEAKAVVDQNQKEHLFVASRFATNNSDVWLIDNRCTNHVTYDCELFKELDTTVITKVRIENGERVTVKGKGTVSIKSLSGKKLIFDVLFVPKSIKCWTVA